MTLIRDTFGSKSESTQKAISASLDAVSDLVRPSSDFGADRHGLTFRDSRDQPVHRWYPYVEGFSPRYLTDVISRLPAQPQAIFDPFGGAGTAQVTASWLNLRSAYSEVNPFMAFVADTKVNGVRLARRNLEKTTAGLLEFKAKLKEGAFIRRANRIDLSSYYAAFPGRDFFEISDIRDLLAAKELAAEVGQAEPWQYSLMLLACASNAVHSSNMTRRADLRRRRADEYVNRSVDVVASVGGTVQMMIEDIAALPLDLAETEKISDDCRCLPSEVDSSFDIAVTSPPYLNGTNYFRNTKIELWLTDFISTEKELGEYRRRAIAAGINNISAKRPSALQFESVEHVAQRLDCNAPDKRIPAMVRHYFSDMAQMLEAVHRALKPGAPFVLDIGDSKYYEIYVPTHRLLVEVAGTVGFSLEAEHVLARRYSRDRSPLVQVELTFRKAPR